MPYRALGYDCSEKSVSESWPLLRRGPYCRTVYFINTRKGKLGTFFTSSSDYVERHGLRVGMRSAVAERRLHKHLTAGCEENLYLERRAAALTVAFSGGVTHVTTLDLAGRRVRAAGHVTGARVLALAMHGCNSDVGVSTASDAARGSLRRRSAW